jgi:hypothetical protein
MKHDISLAKPKQDNFLGIYRQGVYNAIKKGSTVKGIYLVIDNKASTFTAEALANHTKKSIEREKLKVKVFNTQTNEVR